MQLGPGALLIALLARASHTFWTAFSDARL